MIGQPLSTISSQLQVLGGSDIEVGICALVSRGEACDAKLSGELKVESVCDCLPPNLDSTKTNSCFYCDLTPQVPWIIL